jgi:RimJ/RimL family protein N-acetyltransferase
MGLGLIPSCQGKGYGSEAISWALQWAFDSAGMHRVSVKAFEYNTGARRLYEKLGLVHEGTIREMFWHDGRWWADFEYGILDHEWRARQGGKE